MLDSVLRVENIRRSIAGFELGADFTVRSGERLAVMGRSGSGKTTLLRILAGLEPLGQGQGRGLFDGVDLTLRPPEKRNMGFVFQEGALFTSRTVLENVSFGLRMRGVSRSEAEREGRAALAHLGLEHLTDEGVHRLSGGERQRIALIRALIWKPAVLLLDEPFSALDAETKAMVQQDLLRGLSERAIPLVFVTHELSDVERLATRRVQLHEENEGALRLFRDCPV